MKMFYESKRVILYFVAKVKENNMANKKVLMGILVLALVFGMTVVGCGDEESPPPKTQPQPGDSSLDPIDRVESIDLGDMTSEDSGWRQLLGSIKNDRKYINLDLSACTMTGTSFNPDSGVLDGKLYIVSLILPAAATDIETGTSSRGTFYMFSYLKSISGANITTIGDYAFSSCLLLQTANFPNVTNIGEYAFSHCSGLTALDIPKVTNIGSDAFSYTGSTLTVTMGTTAPQLGVKIL